VELSIDTASDLASLALSREGAVVHERSWHCRRNHTVELLPAIDAMLREADVEKGDLSAAFVCIGPGMYTGLRVGVSIGKGLARALGLAMVGVGRLELDAYPHRAYDGDVVAVHRAGRGDLAWAAYRNGPWREVVAPRLSPAGELVATLGSPSLVVGEVDDGLKELLAGRAQVSDEPPRGRGPALARLGWERLAAGRRDDPALLRPIYLRPPAIGPQTAD
jgi:tRNA threonylcarbamoyladenosine biosynthesis protein TsaB